MNISNKIRKFQDRARDQGWRINWIDHYPIPDGQMRVYKTKWKPLFCMVLFIGSLIAYFSTKNPLSVLVAAVSVPLAGIFLLVEARTRRKDWKQIRARCLDKELRLARCSNTSSFVWSWRWLCEFELEGKTFQATPSYWLSYADGWPFGSGKRKAEKLDQKIFGVGNALMLWVNPQNPLECEIVGKDIKDKLLH